MCERNCKYCNKIKDGCGELKVCYVCKECRCPVCGKCPMDGCYCKEIIMEK